MELPRAGLKPDIITLNAVLSGLAAAGRAAACYRLLEQDFPAARCSPDVRTFRSLIRLHALVEKRAEAGSAALQAMQSLGLAPDSECLGMIVHAYAREWKLEEALQLVRRARSSGLHISEHYAALLRPSRTQSRQFSAKDSHAGSGCIHTGTSQQQKGGLCRLCR